MMEKAFPRGGTKHSSNANKFKKPKSFNIFGKVKKVQKKNIDNVAVNINPFELQNTDVLNLTTVQEGTLLLGCVSEVKPDNITFSLPGSLSGIVTIDNISAVLNKKMLDLNEDICLTDLFQKGSYHTVKVKSIPKTRKKLDLTLDPSEINSKLNHKSFVNNVCCTGSVKSKEEHGYIIDFGVNNLTSFLKHNNTGGRRFTAGELVKCVVIDVKSSDSHSNIQVSSDEEQINKSFVKNPDFNIHYFIPGLRFKITVEKVLRNGLKVKYLKDKIGYVNDKFLVNPLDSVKTYEIGNTYDATLLFILPTVNIAFFTLNDLKIRKWNYFIGDIVSSKIVKVTQHGLYFSLGKKRDTKAKCYVPLGKLPKHGNTDLDNEADIIAKYKVGTFYKMRIIYLDSMAGQYIASMDESLLAMKHHTVRDVKCGEIFKSCSVVEIKETGLKITLSSTLIGFVPYEQISDQIIQHPEKKFHVGQHVRARVLHVDVENHKIFLTMKLKYLRLPESELLMSYQQAVRGQKYMGVVVKVYENQLLVKFFNQIMGIIRKKHTPHPAVESLEGYYTVGQMVECTVVAINADTATLKLSLLDFPIIQNQNLNQLKIGEKYNVEIIEKVKNVFIVKSVDLEDKVTGVLPYMHLTEHSYLAPSIQTVYKVGDKLQVYYCIAPARGTTTPIFSIHPLITKFYEENKLTFANLIQENNVIPFSIHYIDLTKNKIILKSCTGSVDEYSIIVHDEYFSDNPNLKLRDLKLKRHQVVLGCVLQINHHYRSIKVSLRLSDCWDHHYETSWNHLLNLLKDQETIQKCHENNKSLIGNYEIGRKIEATVKSIQDTTIHFQQVDGLECVARTAKKLKCVAGDILDVRVVWIDYVKNILHTAVVADDIDISQNIPAIDLNQSKPFKCKIVFKNYNVCVGILKSGINKIIYLPNKIGINDFCPPSNAYDIGEIYKVHIKIFEPNFILGIDETIHKHHVGLRQKKSIKVNKKRKLEERPNKPEIKPKKKKRNESSKTSAVDEVIEIEDLPQDEEVVNSMDVTIKREVDCESMEDESVFPDSFELDVDVKSEVESESENESNKNIINSEKIDVSSSSESEDDDPATDAAGLNVGFNWNALSNPAILSTVVQQTEEDSSTDEEEQVDKSKKRLSRSERIDKAKEEEENIRKKEESLMDRNRDPQTADDFDRLVMFQPDSSQLWIQYMTFHLQNTEIEKARAVARKALKTIAFRLEQEKLNVWLALLNLENLYGSEESLNKVLEEALQFNDPYKIHHQLLNMYVDSNKGQELERLGNLMLRKYKDNIEVWPCVGGAYMKLGKIESARNVLQRALNVVEKKQHVNMIIKFAQLENKYGNQERAQTLYEQILTTFPKRVDVWSSYVDMLVKSGKVDLARQVLERATSQTLPPRKMKTLFKKFLKLEEDHGTAEAVDKVRDAAVKYVENVAGSDDE